jgi:hypothetical protein
MRDISPGEFPSIGLSPLWRGQGEGVPCTLYLPPAGHVHSHFLITEGGVWEDMPPGCDRRALKRRLGSGPDPEHGGGMGRNYEALLCPWRFK